MSDLNGVLGTGGGRFAVTSGGDLWWTSHSHRNNHRVEPIVDIRRQEVKLGCQTATFPAISRIFWAMVRARVRHALRRQNP